MRTGKHGHSKEPGRDEDLHKQYQTDPQRYLKERLDPLDLPPDCTPEEAERKLRAVLDDRGEPHPANPGDPFLRKQIEDYLNNRANPGGGGVAPPTQED